MDETLRKLQLTELEILQVIDHFCTKHQIRYSLYAGTLLGAVRHKGFIPWDDDLDICMERAEYEKFLRTWEAEKPDGYVLQNKDNTPAFTQSFTKIRKEHTTFIQEEWEAGLYHTGIFVDVFPVDRIPDGWLRRCFFHWDCLRYLLYTREFVPPKGTRIQKLISKALLSLATGQRRNTIRKKLIDRISKNDSHRSYHVITTETKFASDTPLPADLLDSFVSLPFEGKEYMCFSNWDAFLTAKFGDYMTPPPESARVWAHHPVIIDFENDYVEHMQSIGSESSPLFSTVIE